MCSMELEIKIRLACFVIVIFIAAVIMIIVTAIITTIIMQKLEILNSMNPNTESHFMLIEAKSYQRDQSFFSFHQLKILKFWIVKLSLKKQISGGKRNFLFFVHHSNKLFEFHHLCSLRT